MSRRVGAVSRSTFYEGARVQVTVVDATVLAVHDHPDPKHAGDFIVTLATGPDSTAILYGSEVAEAALLPTGTGGPS